MAKRMWNEAVDRGINACRSGKYVYFYGAKDIVLTKDLMDYYWNASPSYFKRYNSEEKAQIYRNSIGRKAVDCSGFTGWVCTGDKQYSIGQINNCYKYNSLAAGPTGSLLFTSWGGTGRHIGLDIGNGYCLQAGYESTDKNIALGRAGIYLSPISATAWEKSGQSNVIDYTGAYSPYPPTTAFIEEYFGPQPTPPVTGWVGEVYGKALVTVYQNPTGATPLSVYPALALGNLFEVVGESTNRWQIKIANQYTGWIDKQYVLRKTPYTTGTVQTTLNLRQNAGTNFKRICEMPKGTVVQICDTKKTTLGVDWYYCIYAGQYGFASARYIK